MVLYQKYRPKTFKGVVNQEPVKKALISAIKSDQVAHAYMFSGPRGTGKT
jgi:DNA polymerase-3 subunit gamma/tau